MDVMSWLRNLLTPERQIIEELKRLIPPMQEDLERARFSDEMVFAARPAMN